jgi:chemosensory pili system protein ChpA (sensor histidine kinase/response regulator)
MVEFESLADRLYRVVRQAAKETGKQVRLDIVGGSIEVDRGVLERMTGAFEHLLRNSVTHGIEPALRAAPPARIPPAASHVTVVQEGNEVASRCRDDGAGLDLARIRERAVGARSAGRRRDAHRCRAGQLIFSARLLHRRSRHRAGRPRCRHGRGAFRGQRHGRPHRDRQHAPARARPSSCCCR